MAGSLNHIIGEDGEFTMALIENLGDAHEALEECYALIYELADGKWQKVSAACQKLNFQDPWDSAYDIQVRSEDKRPRSATKDR